MTDVSELIERLNATRSAFPHNGERCLSNPDGPEAASALQSLSERNAVLEEALKPFAAMLLSTEPEISDCMWRSHGAQLRMQAERIELHDAHIANARAALTKEGIENG